jgi:uncharacterized protein YcbK (DUF882 family)
MDRNTQLTKNFRLSEFVRPQDALPDERTLTNIKRLAQALQVIRDKIGKPMQITSGYRTRSHNKAVGGAPNSLHLTGEAADIVVTGMAPRDFQKRLADWPGGLGSYDWWTHLDIRPYRARWEGS